MFTFWQGKYKLTAKKPILFIKYVSSLPFLYISLKHPKISFITNLLLLIPCLILIKELNKKNKTWWWWGIPFLMFFISLRSFLPGIFIALFITKPNFLYGFLALIYSFYSSAMVVLFSFIVFVVLLNKKHFVFLFVVSIPITFLFQIKGFYFGHVPPASELKYEIHSDLIKMCIKNTLRNGPFVWFYTLAFVEGKSYHNSSYRMYAFFKFLILVLVFCIHLIVCRRLYREDKVAFIIYTGALPFSFFEGCGYSSFFICLYIAFVNTFISKTQTGKFEIKTQN